MKIAFAGKGGAGKTTITAWLADHLARRGENVWLVDADTALSLGQASGLDPADLPVPLAAREDLIRERIGKGYMSLNPDVSDLPMLLSVPLPLGGPTAVGTAAGTAPGQKRLLVMGTVPGAAGGCACAANTLLKAVLAHLIVDGSGTTPGGNKLANVKRDWVLVDMEAGVEHLGRGTVQSVDALVVVSEPSLRALSTGAEVARLARELGISRQVLALNRAQEDDAPPNLPGLAGLPTQGQDILRVPMLEGLRRRQLTSGSVLGLPEDALIDAFCAKLVEALAAPDRQTCTA